MVTGPCDSQGRPVWAGVGAHAYAMRGNSFSRWNEELPQWASEGLRPESISSGLSRSLADQAEEAWDREDESLGILFITEAKF